jgi:hypothetical protein
MSKKGSNIPKDGIPDKPDYPGTRPPTPDMPEKRKINEDISFSKLAAIFNLWNKKYANDPDSFSDCLDKNGSPIEDYGENCAVYFQELSNELTK